VRVSVLEQAEQAELGEATCGRGDVSVVEKVVGYKKIKYHTHENVGYGDVHLPEMQMHTTACWFTVPERVVVRQGVARALVLDAMRGIGHALHTVACIGLMADPGDLGTTLGDKSDPQGAHERAGPAVVPGKGVGGGPSFDPTLFLYDHIAGGVGLAQRLYEVRHEFLQRTRALIESCGCQDGCPVCVGPVVGSVEALGDEGQTRKRIALALLNDLGVGLH
jgi:DEAD/DEAH box helicase domain-containing protein